MNACYPPTRSWVFRSSMAKNVSKACGGNNCKQKKETLIRIGEGTSRMTEKLPKGDENASVGGKAKAHNETSSSCTQKRSSSMENRREKESQAKPMHEKEVSGVLNGHNPGQEDNMKSGDELEASALHSSDQGDVSTGSAMTNTNVHGQVVDVLISDRDDKKFAPENKIETSMTCQAGKMVSAVWALVFGRNEQGQAHAQQSAPVLEGKLQDIARWASEQIAVLNAANRALREDLLLANRYATNLLDACNTLQADNYRLVENLAEVRAVNHKLRTDIEGLELRHGEISSESGAYSGTSATPTQVTETFGRVFPLVQFVSRRLKTVVHDYKDLTHGRDVNLQREGHARLKTTAKIMSILFESFENESFMNGGLSIYPDPLLRQTEFFSSFETGRFDSDVNFVNYLERTYNHVSQWVKFNVLDVDKLKMDILKAAQAVWSLHLLCFSFEPPASLFRVGYGANFNGNFMELSESLEVDDIIVAKVAFMIAPGLRIGKFSTIKCKVYPVI